MIKSAQSMLGVLLHAPRVPFIAPRQLGAVESNPGRQSLPSVGWRTGQSGVPPDMHCSLSGAYCFPNLAQPTVEDLEPLEHRTLSGAHRTVRCPIRPLARPCVTRGLRGRPLAGRLLAHQTVRCTTGQYGAPRLRRVLAAQPSPFSFCLFSDSST
jgi:hypothetical protein